MKFLPKKSLPNVCEILLIAALMQRELRQKLVDPIIILLQVPLLKGASAAYLTFSFRDEVGISARVEFLLFHLAKGSNKNHVFVAFLEDIS